MIPPAIGALIRTAVANIQEWAASALDLVKALTIAEDAGENRGTFFRFVNSFVGANPTTTRKEAANAYGAARFFQAQGSILSQWPEGLPIDTRLARSIETGGKYAKEFGSFRTQVEAVVTDELTGKSRTYGFWIETDQSPTPEDLADLASDHLEVVLGKSPPIAGQTDVESYVVDWSIKDYGRYV